MFPIPRLLSNSPLACLGIFPLAKRIESTSHGSITATRCIVTTTSHLLFAVSGSVPEPMGVGERDMLLHHRIEVSQLLREVTPYGESPCQVI